jgi:hypothetical protein
MKWNQVSEAHFDALPPKVTSAVASGHIAGTSAATLESITHTVTHVV